MESLSFLTVVQHLLASGAQRRSQPCSHLSPSGESAEPNVDAADLSAVLKLLQNYPGGVSSSILHTSLLSASASLKRNKAQVGQPIAAVLSGGDSQAVEVQLSRSSSRAANCATQQGPEPVVLVQFEVQGCQYDSSSPATLILTQEGERDELALLLPMSWQWLAAQQPALFHGARLTVLQPRRMPLPRPQPVLVPPETMLLAVPGGPQPGGAWDAASALQSSLPTLRPLALMQV